MRRWGGGVGDVGGGGSVGGGGDTIRARCTGVRLVSARTVSGVLSCLRICFRVPVRSVLLGCAQACCQRRVPARRTGPDNQVTRPPPNGSVCSARERHSSDRPSAMTAWARHTPDLFDSARERHTADIRYDRIAIIIIMPAEDAPRALARFLPKSVLAAAALLMVLSVPTSRMVSAAGNVSCNSLIVVF